MSKASEVERMGWFEIAKSQGVDVLPAWIIRNATSSKIERGDGLWELSIYLFKKKKLELGEMWERRPDGSKVLVSVDSLSGEKSYVLTYTADEDDRILIFRVHVDLQSQQVTILQSSLLADLDQKSFELFYE